MKISLRDILNPQGRRIRILEEIMADLTDPDPCWYDHHGYCQAHSLHEKPCPHERAKELLGDLG